MKILRILDPNLLFMDYATAFYSSFSPHPDRDRPSKAPFPLTKTILIISADIHHKCTSFLTLRDSTTTDKGRARTRQFRSPDSDAAIMGKIRGPYGERGRLSAGRDINGTLMCDRIGFRKFASFSGSKENSVDTLGRMVRELERQRNFGV